MVGCTEHCGKCQDAQEAENFRKQLSYSEPFGKGFLRYCYIFVIDEKSYSVGELHSDCGMNYMFMRS
jgi:hypothetical protein